jgi:hypothetical protein
MKKILKFYPFVKYYLFQRPTRMNLQENETGAGHNER